MEAFISIAGGLSILLVIGIAGWVAYRLMFRKRPGNAADKRKHIGPHVCPLCGSQMQSLTKTPHVVRCVMPGCPNYLDDPH